MVSIAKTLKSLSPFLQILLCALVLALVLKVFVVDAVVIPSHSMERTLLVGDYVLVNKLVHGGSSQRHDHGISDAAGFKFIPSVRSIERGDVVVFQLPSRERLVSSGETWFIKRCVGRSGDEVEIRKGRLYINGKGSSSLAAGSSRDGDEQNAVILKTEENFGPIVVPQAGQAIDLSQRNYDQWEKFIQREGHHIENNPVRGICIDGVCTTQYVVEKNYLFVMGDNRDHSFDSRSWGFLPEENVIGKATFVYWSMDRTNGIYGLTDFFSSIRWSRIGTLIR